MIEGIVMRGSPAARKGGVVLKGGILGRELGGKDHGRSPNWERGVGSFWLAHMTMGERKGVEGGAGVESVVGQDEWACMHLIQRRKK